MQVKVAAQEGNASGVDESRADDAEDHDRVPGGDGDGDHEELVDDKGGEGDADETGAGDGVEEDLRKALDYGALVDGDQDPGEEGAVAEAAAGFELLVKFGVEVCEFFVDVTVEDEREDGGVGVDGGVADHQPVDEETLGVKVAGDAVHGLAGADDETTVHDELGEFGGSFVGVAAVPDEEFGEMVELCDAKVGCQGGLTTLLTDNADSDISGLDHGDVVSTVADTADTLFGVLADEIRYFGLLSWRAPTGNNRREQDGDGDERCPELT